MASLNPPEPPAQWSDSPDAGSSRGQSLYDDPGTLPFECDRDGNFGGILENREGNLVDQSNSGFSCASAFLGEVTKFADKEMFAIRISEPRGDGVHFLVQMWREDVKIIILNPFDDPAQFSCAFYLTGTEPVPDEVIEALAKHLKGDLSLVSGVVFKDKN